MSKNVDVGKRLTLIGGGEHLALQTGVGFIPQMFASISFSR